MMMMMMMGLILFLLLISKAEWIIPGSRPSDGWPQNGNIIFKDFDLKYREGLPLVLNNINCTITRGEKVIKLHDNNSGFLLFVFHCATQLMKLVMRELIAFIHFWNWRLKPLVWVLVPMATFEKLELTLLTKVLCIFSNKKYDIFLLLTDWHSGTHRGWQVYFDTSFVPYSGECWRKNCYRWYWHCNNWITRSSLTVNNYSAGDTRKLQNSVI